jgi:methylated-DNA-[protein]-cysteine S-methyltransferase
MKLDQEAALVFQIERVAAPCGDLLLATNDNGDLCALHWGTDSVGILRVLSQQYGKTIRLETRGSATAARLALEAYLAGDLHAIDTIPVTMQGTAFQREVWGSLRRIRAGTTTSYGALAAQLHRPSAMRAVGLANGSNPVAVVVPCHRVIGADGSLTGYGGGLERKRWLLEHEGVDISMLKQSARTRSTETQLGLDLMPAQT